MMSVSTHGQTQVHPEGTGMLLFSLDQLLLLKNSVVHCQRGEDLNAQHSYLNENCNIKD